MDSIQAKDYFEASLRKFCDDRYSDRAELNEGLRYALFGEGKRVRPVLCLLTCQAFGADPRKALSAALALEMIHTYSLIHDDLPCMDDDDLRRGRPTLHRAFSEATAVLVGDGLLTDSFRVLIDGDFYAENLLLSDTSKLNQTKIMARLAGSHGMVLGQSIDMSMTGKHAQIHQRSIELVEHLHKLKTGGLLGACIAMGAVAAEASHDTIMVSESIGIQRGLSFQIIDDALDESFGTGKSVGKDREAGKLTSAEFKTRNENLAWAERIADECLTKLDDLTKDDTHLKSFILSLKRRSH